jgi:membrane protease YdiL (CAAX protease family)
VAEQAYPNGMPHPPPSLRARIAVELGVLTVATTVFLFFAPRNNILFVGMALIGFALIGFNAQETRERIWGPPDSPEFDRLRRCFINMTLLTLPAALICLFGGIAARQFGAPWIDNPPPILGVNFLIALALYLPWALLQQTLFQFYLLGRLRALFPYASPMLLSVFNGIAYGMVHAPNWDVVLVTILGGIFWSYSYHRDRYVLPIAISHAVLGSTYYYWLTGRDLIGEMKNQFFP